MKIVERGLIIILILAAIVNLIGAFGPELGFDALWYHLTIPKLYLQWGRIEFIPGGLLYYSAMPKLGELFYLGSLKILGGLGEVGPHLMNLGFGIGAGVMTFKLARRFNLSIFYSLLSVIIFYVTPLVGWQSGSGYIDLIRTFFEIAALYFVFAKRPILAGVLLGLAIGTKTLALGSLGILGFLGIFLFNNRKQLMVFLLTAIFLAVPWFMWSFWKTGFPFFPIGTGILDNSHNINLIREIGKIWGMIGDLWKLFVFPEDLISPIYLICLPLIFFWIWKQHQGFSKKIWGLISYCGLAYLFWWITPRTGGGRFILPYLPAWATLITLSLWGQSKVIRSITITIIIFISIINLGYRMMATFRLVPYLTGAETKNEYLCRSLDFSTSVFVDCDGWFEHHITSKDLVLILGTHNLFYVNFPFVHESWLGDEDYNYIMTQGLQNFGLDLSRWKPVYQNDQTSVKVYTRND